MILRFRWVFIAVLAVGIILWLVFTGGGPAKKLVVSKSMESRESSRHRTGQVEKSLPTPLEKRVAQQELRVEERRQVLPALAKAKGPVYLNLDGSPPPVESPEEAAKKVQALQDYDNARREYLVEREVWEKMKLELAEEQKNAKPDSP